MNECTCSGDGCPECGDPSEGFCRKREDGTHCEHWWDGDKPCCACSDNSGADPAKPEVEP